MKEKGRRGYVIFTAHKKRQNQEKPWNILEIVVKALFWAAETKHTNQFHMHEYLKPFFSLCLRIHETHITIYRIVEKSNAGALHVPYDLFAVHIFHIES